MRDPSQREGLSPVPSDLPVGAPDVLWRTPDAMGWPTSKGRAAAERSGHARMEGHPAQPALAEMTLEGAEHALAYAPFGAQVCDPVAMITGWPARAQTIEGTRRALLASLDSDVNVARALGRLEVPRRRIDRWLDAPVTARTEVGPSFGGVHPGWFRVQGERAVCLRCDRARADGWRAIDLAGLALDDAFDVDALRRAHGEGEARDTAFELACVSVWMREQVIGNVPILLERVRALAFPARSPEPDSVRVWIDGPGFVDPSIWAAPGEQVPSARARWLLANLDGIAVGGGTLRVRTEPPIHKPRRAPHREDRATRQRRLFSRWDEGIRVDDEGRVGATPEALAERIAEGARGVVIDGTAGVGALTIAYARQPAVTRVIAIDVDEERLAMARHNARIYGVAERIDFIQGDVAERIADLEADLLVLDPPWGGRDYDRSQVVAADLGIDLPKTIARFDGPVVLKLPRSFDPATLPGEGWALEALVDARGILKMLIARRGPK